MALYNPSTRSLYTTGQYALDPGRYTNTCFGLSYNGGIFVETYSSYSNPYLETYPPVTQLLHCLKTSDPFQVTVYSIPPMYTKYVTPEEDPTYSIQLQTG